MDAINGQLTVFFEDPFWVGLFERVSNGKRSVCKVTFGAEPKDQEVWAFVLKHYCTLQFGPAIEAEVRQTADNPKRRQRAIKKQLQSFGVGTKAQQALQLQRKARKTERRQLDKERQDTEHDRRFALKREKRKAKHKGH